MDPKHTDSANAVVANQRMNFLTLLKNVGPGIVAALTLYAAGDITLMSMMGAQWGYNGLWLVVVAVAGLLAFFTVTARYHLSTGESINWALARTMGGKWVTWWVAIGCLIAAHMYNSYLIKGMGIAWNYMIPPIPSKAWSIIWLVIAVILVGKGVYNRIESLLKLCLACLSITVIYLFIAVRPPIWKILSSLIPGPLPGGTVGETFALALAIMGATTTSVIIFGYAYTVAEKGWSSMKHNRQMTIDAVVGCVLTFVFNTMLYAVAVETLHTAGKKVKTVYDVADVLGANLGPFGYYMFYIAFFAAVFSSVIGFAYWAALVARDAKSPIISGEIKVLDTKDKTFSFWFYFSMIVPVVWTFTSFGFVELMKFFVITLNYFFIIPLAAVILLANGKRFAKEPEKFVLYRASWWENVFLGLTFACMVYFCIQTIVQLF